ncbi:MAG: hypothetical protein PHU49_04255 [Syntrophorhabdaceae bacterium]|nr:hypothetical protein [Syntrophorhabdaceae bacterium]MDD5243208.1 hypothetical protein [Syntrophorhabdaceae bacterium]
MWEIILLGALGGVANCLLMREGFDLPRILITEKNTKTLHPGFFGNIILGIIASLVTYLLGTSQIQPLQQWGIAIVSGLGGGSLLVNLLQKYEVSTLNAKVSTFEKALKTAIKP